jgi:hypothetical protein
MSDETSAPTRVKHSTRYELISLVIGISSKSDALRYSSEFSLSLAKRGFSGPFEELREDDMILNSGYGSRL